MPLTWQSRAQCRDQSGQVTKLFYVERSENYDAVRDKYCNHCAVRTECLEFAIATHEVKDGLWGGMNPRERRTEVKRRKRARRQQQRKQAS